jgi:hypothetical protein
MKSAVFDPSNYSFLELAMANDKQLYQVAYDKWIAVYGSYVSQMFYAYCNYHDGNLPMGEALLFIQQEAKRVANLAVGLKQ